jgi:hypothetical protein
MGRGPGPGGSWDASARAVPMTAPGHRGHRWGGVPGGGGGGGPGGGYLNNDLGLKLSVRIVARGVRARRGPRPDSEAGTRRHTPEVCVKSTATASGTGSGSAVGPAAVRVTLSPDPGKDTT